MIHNTSCTVICGQMSHNFLVKNAPLHLEKHLIYPHIPLRITVGLQPIPATPWTDCQSITELTERQTTTHSQIHTLVLFGCRCIQVLH